MLEIKILFFWKKHSEELKKRLSLIAKERDMSIYHKKVVQIDKITGNVIKVWDSISDASECILGSRKASSRITSNCRGRIKSCGGFIWKYFDSSLESE